MAWASIVADDRLQQQLTQAQAADTKDKAKTSRDGAQRAVRNAWSHILYPVKTDTTEAGKAFDLDHLSLTAKDKGAIPAGVYEKARGDGVVMEKLGPDTLWLKIQPLWPEDRPHLAISEIADWFASYVYLPKLRDRVVLDQTIQGCPEQVRCKVRLCRKLRCDIEHVFGLDLREDRAGRFRSLGANRSRRSRSGAPPSAVNGFRRGASKAMAAATASATAT